VPLQTSATCSNPVRASPVIPPGGRRPTGAALSRLCNSGHRGSGCATTGGPSDPRSPGSVRFAHPMSAVLARSGQRDGQGSQQSAARVSHRSDPERALTPRARPRLPRSHRPNATVPDLVRTRLGPGQALVLPVVLTWTQGSRQATRRRPGRVPARARDAEPTLRARAYAPILHRRRIGPPRGWDGSAARPRPMPRPA
jgi:hypothetical protein